MVQKHTVQEFAHGRVRIVEPSIVIEVTFDRVQPSKRHKSGYALRFPRILRLRPDKAPAEIDTLETVRRLVESSESGRKGESTRNEGKTGAGLTPHATLLQWIDKVPIASKAGWGYDAARHRLPVSFSNVDR